MTSQTFDNERLVRMVTSPMSDQLYLGEKNKPKPGGFKMKRYIAMIRIEVLLAVLLLFGFSNSRAQQITHVDFDLPSLDYDVIYLADFIDVTSNKLASNIPNFSGTIRADGNGQIILDITALIQFKGESSPQQLVFAETQPFTVNFSRTISSSDIATGGVSDIKIKNSPYYENQALRDRITNYAKEFPTAPVGQYYLQLTAYAVTSSGGKGGSLGSTQKIITVRNASPDEVQITLIDPQPGQVVPTSFPTFSWATSNSNVTLFVYEMRPSYGSLQDAITGVPYLQQDISGSQTFTYSTNARHLDAGKSYVWFVQAAVVTNRQTVQRQSEIRLFRVQSDNNSGQDVSNLLNGIGGSAAGTFATLQNMGWVPAGTMTLDGKPLSLDDLKALVAKLTAQNVQITVRVE